MNETERYNRARRLWQAYAAQQHKLMRETIERAGMAEGERRAVLLRLAGAQQRRNLADYSIGRGDWHGWAARG